MEAASEFIDKKIAALADWRGDTLAQVRAIIRKADDGVVEEVKWGGTPVWSLGGILCTGETYKAVVKLTFAKGASLADPAKLFNSSLEGNARRAIDIREGERIDAPALTALIRAAAALNRAGKGKQVAPKASAAAKPAGKAPAVKPAGKAPAAKPAAKAPLAKPAGKSPAAKPAAKAPLGKPAAKAPVAKPAGKAPAAKPAGKAKLAGKAKPAAKAPPAKPAGKAPATKAAKPAGKAR